MSDLSTGKEPITLLSDSGRGISAMAYGSIEYVTVGTVARALNRPITTVREWVYRGHIRAEQSTPEGWYRIPRSEIDRIRRGDPLESAA